jgi:hypothetical protein
MMLCPCTDSQAALSPPMPNSLPDEIQEIIVEMEMGEFSKWRRWRRPF